MRGGYPTGYSASLILPSALDFQHPHTFSAIGVAQLVDFNASIRSVDLFIPCSLMPFQEGFSSKILSLPLSVFFVR